MDDEKNKGGRPRIFSSPEEMQEKIDHYFNEIVTSINPPTVAGLSFHLGFSDRHTLTEYAKYPEFSATVKRAKLQIEMFLEKRLLWDGPVVGPIFNLKNNFGWKDKVETENTHKVDGKVVLWGNPDTE